MSKIEGYSQALEYYNNVASQSVRSMDAYQKQAGKTAITNRYNEEAAAEPSQDFVDEYVPSKPMAQMSASLAMAKQKSEAFIEDFVQAANMFDALLISQQKADVFINQFLQSSKAADAFVDEFMVYKT